VINLDNRPFYVGTSQHLRTLRANISETGLVLLINEQKGEKAEIRDEREFSWCCSFFWGLAAAERSEGSPPGEPQRSGAAAKAGADSQSFFRWYNEEHRHSGIGLLTPATVHYGQAENVLRQRQEVLDVAYRLHPERFVRSAPKPPALPSEVWINKPVSTPELLSV